MPAQQILHLHNLLARFELDIVVSRVLAANVADLAGGLVSSTMSSCYFLSKFACQSQTLCHLDKALRSVRPPGLLPSLETTSGSTKPCSATEALTAFKESANKCQNIMQRARPCLPVTVTGEI